MTLKQFSYLNWGTKWFLAEKLHSYFWQTYFLTLFIFKQLIFLTIAVSSSSTSCSISDTLHQHVPHGWVLLPQIVVLNFSYISLFKYFYRNICLMCTCFVLLQIVLLLCSFIIYIHIKQTVFVLSCFDNVNQIYHIRTFKWSKWFLLLLSP